MKKLILLAVVVVIVIHAVSKSPATTIAKHNIALAEVASAY